MDGNLRSLEHRSKVALSHEVLREASFGSPIGNALGFSIVDPSFHLCSVPFPIQRPAKKNVQCEYGISFHASIAYQTIHARYWFCQSKRDMLTFRTSTAEELQYD